MRPNSDKVYLQQLIAEGEHQQQDFKFEISDARKIARSLSAFSNTDGGRLLIGVKAVSYTHLQSVVDKIHALSAAGEYPEKLF